MPLPAELVKIDLVWSFESGQEIAVNTIWGQHHHTSGSNFQWGDGLQKVCDKVISSLSTGGAGTSILTPMVNNVTLTRVDAYQVGTNGLAVDKRTAMPATPTDIRGGASGSYVPLMGAVVQLWGFDPTTFVQRPRRRRGRLFVPGTPSTDFTNTGELSTTRANNIAQWWSDFLNDLQGAHMDDGPDIDADYLNVGVLSRADEAFYQLESITCALKPGIQHRRMNKLASLRSTAHAIDHS